MNVKCRLELLILACCLFALAACTSNESLETPSTENALRNAEPLALLDAEEVSALGSYCQEICERQINAWSRRETDGLSDIYTEDIVHFDGDPDYKGIKAVTRMAKDPVTNNGVHPSRSMVR